MKLIFGYRDPDNFHAINIVAGQANGTSTELDISDIRVVDGTTTRTNPFDTFSTANFSAGFSRSPTVLHGQVVHDSLNGSVSVTISEAGSTVFTGSVTNDAFLEDGDIGFGMNNDAASFDNLVVDALPRLTLQVDPVDGDIQVVNGTGTAIDLDLYEITSFDSEGAGLDLLDAVNWSSLEEQNRSGFEAGDGTGNGWEAGDASNANTLVEANLTSSSSVADSTVVYLGEAVADGTTEGIAWRYHVPGTGNTFVTGIVEYTDVVPPTGLTGDFNDDGIVDSADYALWRNNLNGAESVLNGNGDGSGTVDAADLALWKQNFGLGAAAAASAAATPEPSSLVIFLMGGLAAMYSKRTRAAMAFALLIATMTVLTPTAEAIEFDRILGFGEEESASIGGTVTTTFDSTAPFVDVAGFNGPQYVSIAGRPGAAADGSTIGISFDGTDDYLSGLRFGNPETSRGATGTTVGVPFANAINYDGIRNRGMQVWVNPASAGSGSRQAVMADTNQFGVLISDAATPTWILLSNGVEYDSGVDVTFDSWSHVSVVREFGVGTTLFLDGVGVARTSSSYDTSDTANLVFGSNTSGTETVFDGGTTDYFQGVLDQAELFAWGEPDGGPSLGDFNFGRDNGFARLPVADGGVSKVAGDITGDGVLDSADVDAFVASWLSSNGEDLPFNDGSNSDAGFGDINSLARGDLDYSGVTDIRDAFLLHQALVSAGAGALNFELLIAGVPEPSTGVLAAFAASGIAIRRRRRGAASSAAALIS